MVALAYLTNSEHSENSSYSEHWSSHRQTTSLDREKAWHILSLLLSIGRPAHPTELASRCGLFNASPELIHYLCSIPDSPVFMRTDLFVTISLRVLFSVREFACKGVADFALPRLVRVSGVAEFVRRSCYRKRKGSREEMLTEIVVTMPKQKRRLLSLCGNDGENRLIISKDCNKDGNGDGDEDENVPISLLLENKIRSAGIEAHSDVAKVWIRNMNLVTNDMYTIKPDKRISSLEASFTPLLLEPKVYNNELVKIGHTETIDETQDKIVHEEFPGYVKKEIEDHSPGINIDLNIPNSSVLECDHIPALELNIMDKLVLHNETQMDYTHLTQLNIMDNSVLHNETHMDNTLLTQLNIMDNSVLHDETQMDNTHLTQRMCLSATICPETKTHCLASPVNTGVCDTHGNAAHDVIVRVKMELGSEEESNLARPDTRESPKDPMSMDSTLQMHRNDSKPINSTSCGNGISSMDKNSIAVKVECQALPSSAEPSTSKKRLTKPSAKLKIIQRKDPVDHSKSANSKLQENAKQDQKCTVKEKSKHTITMLNKESRPLESTSIALKKQMDTKSLPNFESFVIEEEEGSGGYGTVYRAKRKNDGKTFAIKCPHPNAHTHHVNNELKMLERFGGRNFVIKFEGSFKNGNSECFVLEHVEHDRPEVLKREIDVFELRWYGYCMFRALASLHKQGVVHRDVKPGNFLFSRKLNKGYLIDFNLAMDLHQKYAATSKSKICSRSFDHVPLPNLKYTSTKVGKVPSSKFLDAANQEATKQSKLSLEPKNMKKRASATYLKPYPDLGSANIFKSQGADGSGITSTKDATSNRTPSAERREQIYYKGRKELVNLAKALEGVEHKARCVPASQSKRIAAPLGKVDRKHMHLSPMPLHSSGIAVSGAGLLKNKGDGKHKREGPCVGTKGFRAPEVLFKSLHQGYKVDVWSAGVALLYLIIGKAPFVGDPEQNIKDIAKLRGSEDLWEVAKLHNRESSFPEELYDIQSLSSVELREWCKLNAKRPEFIEFIPGSLFDLVDKCLTVNPRLRITAEEALRHDFFSRCHDDLRKQRRLRQGPSLDSIGAPLPDGQL